MFNRFLQIALFLPILGGPRSVRADVMINEFMSANSATISDENGDSEDWIELINDGASPVDLSNWGLSDEQNTPFKWTFPTGTTIPAGETLGIWASGKDRLSLGGIFHTNFSILADGEPLFLTDSDGSLVDSLPAIVLRPDISFGRTLENPQQLGYFSEPTPGTPNSSTAFEGILPPPTVSIEGGFYNSAVTVDVTPPEGASVYYSLDGSDPSPDRLDGEDFHYKSAYPRNPEDPFGELYSRTMKSHLYTNPIEVTDRTGEANQLPTINTWFEPSPRTPTSNLNKATTLRVRSHKPGFIPSEIITNSYFIHPDIFARHTLPVVSITTDDCNLFDYDAGIYVPGRIADDWRIANPTLETSRSQIPGNATRGGMLWERPAHVEFFQPDGTRIVSQNLGIRIHGGASRSIYTKSLRLYARSGYDQKNTIDYPIFGELPKEGSPDETLDEFSTVLLRNAGNDSRGLFFRDAIIQDLISHLPLETQGYQPALHYINGESWGLTNIRERMDEDYLSGHFDFSPNEAVIITPSGYLESGQSSDTAHFSTMRSHILGSDMSSQSAYDQVEQWLDIENFSLYHAFEIYIDNYDWPFNNSKLWRKRTVNYDPDAPKGQDGRWRWLVYDVDFGFTNHETNTINRLTNPPGQWWSQMLVGMLENPEFKNLFINDLADLRNTTFHPSRVDAATDAFVERLDPARGEHVTRWLEARLSYTTARSLAGVFKRFGTLRPDIIEQHIISRFGLAGAANLTVNIGAGGKVRVNRTLIAEDTPGIADPLQPYPWTGRYYQGIPVTLKAEAEEGHRFAGWLELPGETSPEITPSLTGDATFTALFEVAPERTTVHAWNFEFGSTTTPSQGIGNGMISPTLDPGSNLEINAPDKGFDSNQLRINAPLNGTLTFSLPTDGFQNLEFTFDTRRSGQGTALQEYSYTLDGVAWTPIDTIAVLDDDPQTHLIDISLISGAEDNPLFAIQIEFARSQTQIDEGTGMAGNVRFDNVTLSGEFLPAANLPPVVSTQIGPQHVSIGSGELSIDLGNFITDPDATDVLSYTATFDPPSSASASTSTDQLGITGLSSGNTMVSVTAIDPHGASISTSFSLLVYPQAHPLSESDFLFREWSDQEAANSFPPSMIFVQGSGNNDSTLSTPLNLAYHIPTDDASDPDDVLKPYAASNRTRINGLSEDGISIINTGRGRDLGGIILALDTRNITSASIGWVAGTVLPNSRSYGLRLQARSDSSAPFEDVQIDSAPVEYLSNPVAGHHQVFNLIPLPSSLLGFDNVQLQWRYHLLSGSSGPRAQLSLDDIVVTTNLGPRDYEAWRLTEFPIVGDREDDEISGPETNTRFAPNLLRYGLGAGPSESLSELLPRLESAQGTAQFTFPFDSTKKDLRYKVSSSESLSDWSTIIFDSHNSDWESLLDDGRIKLPTPIAPPANTLFYRLEVTQEPYPLE
ncbi:CotH kinase family protein [Haloferula sp.]|uniref:CotH kinase family protein n=1 Tax=Haloferula sp. TaxID=2497595 RepID=UPI0032A0BB3F